MNRKTVPGRKFRRPIMVRSRRKSHHSDGITDPNNLQQISATKSARSGLVHCSKLHLYSITSSAMERMSGGMVRPSESQNRSRRNPKPGLPTAVKWLYAQRDIAPRIYEYTP